MRSRQRECRRIVVDRRRLPRARRVADDAVRRDARGRMRRLRRGVERRLVAGETIERRAGVGAVHVTRGTANRHVRPGQRERRGIVVQRRRLPGIRRMALATGGREVGVRRVDRGLGFFQVTGRAFRRQRVLEREIRVTAGTLRRLVRTGQRKPRQGVIEIPRSPRERRMTLGTIHRETGRHMVRVARGPEGLGVTSLALHGRVDETHGGSLHRQVASGAIGAEVGTGQREARGAVLP